MNAPPLPEGVDGSAWPLLPVAAVEHLSVEVLKCCERDLRSLLAELGCANGAVAAGTPPTRVHPFLPRSIFPI